MHVNAQPQFTDIIYQGVEGEGLFYVLRLLPFAFSLWFSPLSGAKTA
jgi:hypothetical protein